MVLYVRVDGIDCGPDNCNKGDCPSKCPTKKCDKEKLVINAKIYLVFHHVIVRIVVPMVVEEPVKINVHQHKYAIKILVINVKIKELHVMIYVNNRQIQHARHHVKIINALIIQMEYVQIMIKIIVKIHIHGVEYNFII